jgi:hypothetical protein
MERTQYDKILVRMIRLKGQQEWFFPYDFMQNGMGDLFVGYEASARLSELSREYPLLIESVREGKYKKHRFKFENVATGIKSLPQDLMTSVVQELTKVGALQVDKF